MASHPLTKQFARDWLKANPDNTGLPQDIVDKTIGKYLQGYEMLTGEIIIIQRYSRYCCSKR